MNRTARTHTFEVTFRCGTVATFTATASGVPSVAAAWAREHGADVVTYIRAL